MNCEVIEMYDDIPELQLGQEGVNKLIERIKKEKFLSKLKLSARSVQQKRKDFNISTH